MLLTYNPLNESILNPIIVGQASFSDTFSIGGTSTLKPYYIFDSGAIKIANFQTTVTSIGFFGSTPITKRSGSIFTALSAYGLIDNPVITYSDLSGIPGNITLQGNTFNIASTLVQLTSATKYPAIDGSLITGLTNTQVGLSAVTNDAQVKRTEMGAALGVSTLDAGGKIPHAQLPFEAYGETFSVASQAAMLALTAQPGDSAIRTDDGNHKWLLLGSDPTILSNWVRQLTITDSPVQSVAGRTGAVVLTSTDVGLPNVPNVDTSNASNISSGTLNDLRLSNNVTLAGNSFNGVSQLVRTTVAGYLPALNGSLITGLTNTQVGLGSVPNIDATNASNISSGSLADGRLSANVTLAGNTFNGINQLVKLNGSGYLPALNGSLLTSLPASSTLSDSSNIPLLNAGNIFSAANNTFTTPKIITGVKDTNGNIIIGVNPVASAVNYLQVTNGIAGSPGKVTIQPAGASSVVDLELLPKGGGSVIGAGKFRWTQSPVFGGAGGEPISLLTTGPILIGDYAVSQHNSIGILVDDVGYIHLNSGGFGYVSLGDVDDLLGLDITKIKVDSSNAVITLTAPSFIVNGHTVNFGSGGTLLYNGGPLGTPSAGTLTNCTFPILNQNTTGNAATVTNATLTTALTVNTGTVTLIGNAANTSALTIAAGAVSVAGTNTGDQTPAVSNSIFVDVNGNDSTGVRGRLDKPFLTVSGALGAAGITAGDVIHIGPGTFTENSGVQGPAGVSVKGSGIDITIIQSSLNISTSKVAFCPGSNSLISDLTVTSTIASGAAFGAASSNTGTPGNVIVRNCKFNHSATGGSDAIYFNKNGLGKFIFYDVIATCGGDTVFFVTNTSSGILEFYNCEIVSDGSYATASTGITNTSSGGIVRVFGGLISCTGNSTINTNVKSGGVTELWGTRLTPAAGGGTNKDLDANGGTLTVSGAARTDSAAFTTNGTITYVNAGPILASLNAAAGIITAGTWNGSIITSAYGGTGNGFTKFSGPTTSEKTKTLRDANDTILELGGSYTPTGTWTSLTLVTPALGTPASGIVTNLTGTASININGTVGATTPAAGTFTTLVAGSTTSLLLGTAGSAVGNIGFRNATSGTATLAPPTGALGTYTITLPNAASTIPVFGQQITFLGPTAARSVTFPDANFTAARTDAANTFTGHQTIEGVTSTGATGTGNFMFSISPTTTGTLTADDINLSTATKVYKINSTKVVATDALGNYFFGPAGNTSASGGYNVGIGTSSLASISSGTDNLAMGVFSLWVNGTGSYNSAMGSSALAANTDGSNNVAIGRQAVPSNTKGYGNVGVGVQSLYSFNVTSVSDTFNSAIGLQAGYDLTTGTNNVFVGANAGKGITTGGKNTIIGTNVTGLTSTLANTVIIADGDGNKRIYIDNNANIGIGGLTTFGTSAAKVFGMPNTGTEPSTSPIDMVQLYCTDLSAGNATLGLRTETAVVTETVTSDRTLSIRVNGVTYKILLKS